MKDYILMAMIIFDVLFYVLIVFMGIMIFNSLVSQKHKIVILKSKTVCLGTLNVDEITIVEWKPLFSLKTFYFHKGHAQEIFHTHSFTAISLLLYGNYIESFYDEKTGVITNAPRNRSRLITIPRERYHQITKSEGCRTIMLTGPWGDTYKEYDPVRKQIITSTHGRKEISRMNQD